MGRLDQVIVLDTSALLFWTLDPVRLSAEAQQIIDQSTAITICSISIWEIGIKVKKGKLDLPLATTEYVTKLKRLHNLQIMPVDENIWLENVALAWSHQDPADRTIVACAKLLNCPLVTSDKTILAFYAEAVW